MKLGRFRFGLSLAKETSNRMPAALGARARSASDSGSSSSDLHDLSSTLYRSRLAGCASVLGLGGGGRVRESLASCAPSISDLLSLGDYLLCVLDILDDRAKCALSSCSKAILAEQRRLRPATIVRPRVSLAALLGARAAGWRMTHCHVDKRSGDWSTRKALPERDALADLHALSVCGRPDCALLVLSPFTALGLMRELRILEFEKCAIGDAGLGVLSAAFRTGAMPALTVRATPAQQPRAPCSFPQLSELTALLHASPAQILDVRSNQIGDVGVTSLASAASHTLALAARSAAAAGRPGGRPPLAKLCTLGVDYNPRVGEAGLGALSHALRLGALPALHSCL